MRSRVFTGDCAWQHHFLNVYRADIDGDHAKVLVYHTSHQLFEHAPDTVHEIVARNAPVLALVTDGDRSLEGVATDVFKMPAVEEAASAILNTVMLQLFAYHVATTLGQDVDQPRNLAKSVTVE